MVIDGGIVECIEGIRQWMLTDDGREVLILIQGKDQCQRKIKSGKSTKTI